MTAHALLLAASLATATQPTAQHSRPIEPTIIPQEQKAIIETPTLRFIKTQANQRQAYDRAAKLRNNRRNKGQKNRRQHRLDQRSNNRSSR